MAVRSRRRSRWAAAAGLLIAGAALAAAVVAVGAVTASDNVIRACASKRTGALRIVKAGKRCRRHERRVTWSRRGPAGRPGAPGAPGAAGHPGGDGKAGLPGAAAASMVMGNTDAALPAGAGAEMTLAPSGFTKSDEVNSDGDTQVSPSAPVVVRDLYVRIDNAPGSGASRVFELLDDGRPAVACTIADTQDSCTTGDASATVSPGSDLTIRQKVIGDTPAAATRGARWAFRALSP